MTLYHSILKIQEKVGLAMQLQRTVELAGDQSMAMAIEDFPAGAEAK